MNKYTHIPHHLKMSALTIEIPIMLIDCGKNRCANIVAPKFKLGENELDIDHKALGFIVIEFDISFTHVKNIIACYITIISFYLD